MRLKLRFPYLMEKDGTARPLGCVDVEVCALRRLPAPNAHGNASSC